MDIWSPVCAVKTCTLIVFHSRAILLLLALLPHRYLVHTKGDQLQSTSARTPHIARTTVRVIFVHDCMIPHCPIRGHPGPQGAQATPRSPSLQKTTRMGVSPNPRVYLRLPSLQKQRARARPPPPRRSTHADGFESSKPTRPRRRGCGRLPHHRCFPA